MARLCIGPQARSTAAIKYLVGKGAEIETTEIKSRSRNGNVVTPAVIMAAVEVLMIVYVHCWRQEPMVGTLSPAISPCCTYARRTG